MKKKDKRKEELDLEAEESNNSPIDIYYDNDDYYSYSDYDYGDDVYDEERMPRLN